MGIAVKELTIHLRQPHPKQARVIDCPAKRIVLRAGRRFGKTTAVSIRAVERFLQGRRQLYATPTIEQAGRFWKEVSEALAEPIKAGLYYKNETEHVIELLGTEQRIKAKTAHDADTLRGDYADDLYLDEFQDMNEDAWTLVGAPMLIDNNGDAFFIYTKKRGKNHTNELFKRAQADTSGRWATFVFSSHDNPHISEAALADITGDMTNLAYRMEILAEDIEDDPRALWSRGIIDHVTKHPELSRIVVGVDPPGGATEAGIVAAGIAKVDGVVHGYVLADKSRHGSPAEWGSEAVSVYHVLKADRVVGEKNFGGDMVENVIATIDKSVSFKAVHASRGKAARAEPVVALYEKGRVHHVGEFQGLEDEMCNWVPGESTWSPNRCFPSGTMVTTINGDKPIEEISPGDLVLTRSGYRRVLAQGQTAKDAELLQLILSYGIILECTPNHPIFVFGKGFIPACTIQKSDQFAVLASRLPSLTGLNTGVTQIARANQPPDISILIPPRKIKDFTASLACMSQFGKAIMVLSLKVAISTIKTAISIIMKSKTLKWLHPSSTASVTVGTIWKKVEGEWTTPVNLPPNGTAAKRGERGILSKVKNPGMTGSPTNLLYALSAKANSIRSIVNEGIYAFAHESALTATMNAPAGIMKNAPALSVKQYLQSKRASPSKYVPVNVLGICEGKRADVYDLTVEGAHEFFANGVLVHNCDAAVWVLTELMLPAEMVVPQIILSSKVKGW